MPVSIKFLEYLAYAYTVLSIIGAVFVWAVMGSDSQQPNFPALFMSIATIVQGLIGSTIMLVISYIAESMYIMRNRK